MLITLFITRSFKKCALISICFVRLLFSKFLEVSIAPLLSTKSFISHFSPKFSDSPFIFINSLAVAAAAMYSASAVDKATTCCFLENHEIKCPQ